MEPNKIRRSKSQDSGLNKIINFFEIKRPAKSTSNSSSLPRSSSNSNEKETENVIGDKMFIRRHSQYSTSRKNKYKKVTKEVNHKECETKKTFEDMCRMYENKNVSSEENTKKLNSVSEASSTHDEYDDRKQLLAKIAEREAKLEELNSIGEADEIIKRIVEKRIAKIMTELTILYQRKEVKLRDRRKITSFVEAENEKEAEEYRKSLIQKMDYEFANMKADGFMDDDEHTTVGSQFIFNQTEETDNVARSQHCGSPHLREDTFLDIMRYNSKHVLDDAIRKSDDSQHTIQNEIIEDETKGNPDRILLDDDEFSESLGDGIEDGVTVVEAYNDEGRELIEIKVIFDRRTIALGTEEHIEVPIEESQMVFYHQEDNNTYELLHDTLGDDFITEKDYREEIRIYQNYTEDNDLIGPDEHIYEDIEDPREKQQMKFYQGDHDTVRDDFDKEKGSREDIRSIQNDIEENNVFTPDGDNPAQHFFVYSPPASNRSTVYSGTSRESSGFDEDDESIELGKNNDDPVVYSNVRRETFCDDKGIIRIERVANHGTVLKSNASTAGHGDSSPVSRSNSTTPARQLQYIVDEIVTTERKYVEDLGKIIKVYKPYIEDNTPPHLVGMAGYLFGNIERIHRKQTKFLEALEKCSHYVNGVVRCFIDHKSVFELYQFYFRNKRKADILLKDFNLVIKDMQETFEERLDFSAYLLTPVQRLGKYILFLENIEKQLSKLNQPIETVQEALNIVRSEMTKGNDAVAAESIENSPISRLDYGSFKLREKFSIIKPRKLEAMVFLFENVLVFTTNDQRNLEIFNYYDSIKMTDLRIATFEDYTIHLTDYTKSKKKNNLAKYTYVLEAKNEKLWNVWKKCIEDVLWKQLYEVKESVKVPSLGRYKRHTDRNRIKSTGMWTKDHRFFM
ncbi:unnamed protein product [Phaedon cochleariae]|uniref:DH domain-containing protein n=1 Tax=Phaedon cochleariae TaxID=80249 RepID=A0A9P0DSB8_PHACE|nr:unnamed protein product [Phaedon cochleariae]